ncbi:MAG: hypothetical protein ACLQHS_16955 [Candidatus Limnocylindrales bacterium]
MSATPNQLDACELFTATFAGSRNDYAEWIDDHWRRAGRSLTARVVHAAFASGRPLSFYSLSSDNRAVSPALDIDRDDGVEQGGRLVRRVHELGGVAYLERSRRGCHVRIPVDAPLPGILARRALRQLCREADVADDPKVELRPGSDRLYDRTSVGHCLRAPTMPHPATHRRYPLETADGRRLPLGVVDLMLAVDVCPAAVMVGLAERYVPPSSEATSAPRRAADPGSSPIATFNREVGCSAVLIRDWGCDPVLTRPGRTVRCPAHPDARPSLSIARNDDRVWCHSPTCDLHGPEGAGHDAFSLWALARARRGAVA